MGRSEWDNENRKIPPLARLQSYSAYLEVAYRDLIASLGIDQAPCSGTTGAASIGPSRDLSVAAAASSTATSKEEAARHRRELEEEHEPISSKNIEARRLQEEQPYCQAYNLILTGRWMMAVPRSKARFDKDVAVNGLGG